MYWKCRSGLRSEDGTLDETESEETHSLLNFFNYVGGGQDDFSTPLNSSNTWWRWVDYYTSRSLTRSEDRTAAITGIIRYFQRLTGGTPILGLWESSFIRDLTWSGSGNVANTPVTGPSWSWLSHPQQTIDNQPQYKWFERESNVLEPRLESFNVQWTGSPFTSRLVSSTLHVSGVIRTLRVTKGSPRWDEGFHVAHPNPNNRGSPGEVLCTLDDGSEIADGLNITCLFLFYSTEHIETEDYNGYSHGESRRWEYFLIIAPHRASGLSASEPIVISDSNDDVTPKSYRRLGAGNFEVELIPKDEWVRKRVYDNTSWPNPPLMFDRAKRITIELV